MLTDSESPRALHRRSLLLVRFGTGLALLIAAGVLAYVIGAALLEKNSELRISETNASARQTYRTLDGRICDIAVVPLSGTLNTTQEDAAAFGGASANTVVAQINQAEADPSIRGIILQINSPGGSPVGGEMIANALKGAHKPTTALIQEQGDSAAYFAATGANMIIASPISDTVDIGVTGSYLDQSKGANFIQISAGKYKDAGNPSRPLSVDEKALLQRNVDEEYKTLIGEIAANRKVATTTIAEIADGSSMPGTKALLKHLVDQLGDSETARNWFKEKLGGPEPILCTP